MSVEDLNRFALDNIGNTCDVVVLGRGMDKTLDDVKLQQVEYRLDDGVNLIFKDIADTFFVIPGETISSIGIKDSLGSGYYNTYTANRKFSRLKRAELPTFLSLSCRKCGVLNPLVYFAPVGDTCICFDCAKERGWVDDNGDLYPGVEL